MKALERVRMGGRGQGTLAKFEGSPNWVSCYYVRGTEHRESTGTPDLKLARRVHKQKLDEVAADRQGLKPYLAPAARRTRVDELLDDLEADARLRQIRSWASFQSHVKPVRAHFGGWCAPDVTAAAVDAYIEDRLEDDCAPATINRGTQLLGQAFRLALGRGKVTVVPSIRHLPEKNVREGFFERPEFEAVVAALPEHLQDFARFAFLTGWRRGEIISLRWTDVDRDGGVIRLRPEHSKNGHARVVPFAAVPQLGSLMERRWQARLLERAGAVLVADLVFHRGATAIADFRKAWASACIAAGLYHVERDADGSERKVHERLFHDLRRTAVRNMVRAGVDPAVAMKISGHRTRAVFDRYNIIDERDISAAMRQTGRYVDALPTTREGTA
jgi:integrase